jgi:hypothetical protein
LFKFSLGERLLFVLLILVEVLTITVKKVQTVKVNNSTNINKTNNNLSPKESLNSEGQQFHQFQQNKQ